MYPGGEITALTVLRETLGHQLGTQAYEALEDYALDVMERHRCDSPLPHVAAIIFHDPDHDGHFHALHGPPPDVK